MKPIIFFSHSSRDRDALLPIRDRQLEGTGNAIAVFMSSDGASIPFGRNWLKEIENALTECRLMFVWMTPTSLSSNWILFESGFAYSKGIRVVPVGFQGVQLEQLSAPINMLQGFNITSPPSLNNLVAIINEEFSLTFPDLYDEEFYRASVEDITSEDSPELLDSVRLVECFCWPRVKVDDRTTAILRSDWFDVLRVVLTENDTSFFEDDRGLFGTGFRVRRKLNSSGGILPSITIDPLALNTTRGLWANVFARLYDAELARTVFKLHLVAGLELPDDESLIGARLLKSDVSFDTEIPHMLYRYRNIDFRFTTDRAGSVVPQLFILVPKDDTGPIPILSLLRLLKERHILTAS